MTSLSFGRCGMSLVFLLSAVRAGTAQEVTRTQVAPNLWRIDGAVDVIVAQTGPDGLLLVDTGYPFAEVGVREQLRAIAGTDRADLLLNTHWHHTYSNHLYGAEADVVAHDGVARRMAGTNLMGGQLVGPMPAAGRPDRTFADSLTIRFNGDEITLLHFPAAHTDGDAVVFFREANVVLTGDIGVPHVPWVDWGAGGEIDALIGALNRLVEIVPEDAVIVPGHDANMTATQLRAYRDMLAAARDTVAARMERGMTLTGIVDAGIPGLEPWSGGVPVPLFVQSVYRSLVRARPNPRALALAFENGRWFNGTGFTSRVMYAVDGVLTERRPAGIDSTVDLDGGFVVPPFGEAHTHRLSDPMTLPSESDAFLEAGVFYAMVQDPIRPVSDALRRSSADPARVDVAYTQGVVAPSWHAIADMYVRFAEQGMFGDGVSFDDVDGDVIFTLDTVDEVIAAWPALAARNDRFLKIIVAFSDELDRRRDDRVTYGSQPGGPSARPGVSPAVLRAVVERAHAAGLRVSAHIETAADFRLAADAGADLIAHMPAAWQIGEGTGYGPDELDPWLLSPDDAMAARRAGTTVITTLRPNPGDPRADLFRRVHARNLALLLETGVGLAIGSDSFEDTAVGEVAYLHTLGALDAPALLQLIAVQTPRVIFPDRKIGILREGYEASFLVLAEDPLEDVEHLRNIRLTVKRGELLR